MVSKKAVYAALMIGAAGFFLPTLISFRGKNPSNTIEAEKLILKNPKGKSTIELGFLDDVPYIVLQNEEGKGVAKLEGGKEPSLVMHDDANRPRLHMQGGTIPGVYLKNAQEKTVSSWTMLSDGGAGFGLADNSGNAAAILRGGSSPSVAFFSSQNEPMAALGMIQQVPHLLISGPVGSEGILIHGGAPSSMLVVDEVGKVKIMISKQGVFQGKEEGEAKKRENRVFSYDDKKTLFPSLTEEATR